jgi:hypothetical protein
MRSLWKSALCWVVAGAMSLGLLAGPGWAATYYVAPHGDDADPGSKSRPFATWQKGHDVAIAGDTIYLRGGVYRVSAHRRQGVDMRGRRGKPGAPIRMWAYPGERPVLDCRGLSYDSGMYGILLEEDWWHFRGLTIRGVPEANAQSNSAGMVAENVSHCIFESMEFSHNGGPGFGIAGESADNLIQNCDAHDNYDALGNGEDADGFHLAFTTPTSTGNRFVGCRSWRNSDDGFDLWEAEGAVLIDNCWAFWNGCLPDSRTPASGGDGNGFKLGRNARGPRHVVQRCLAFENLHRGFDDNGATGPQDWLNNTAYANKQVNFMILGPYPYRLRNNLSYRGGGKDEINAAVDQANNSWTLPVTVTDADFASLKSAGCDGPRQPDGSLPNLEFLAPAKGSHLIGLGVAVRWPWDTAVTAPKSCVAWRTAVRWWG